MKRSGSYMYWLVLSPCVLTRLFQGHRQLHGQTHKLRVRNCTRNWDGMAAGSALGKEPEQPLKPSSHGRIKPCVSLIIVAGGTYAYGVAPPRLGRQAPV